MPFEDSFYLFIYLFGIDMIGFENCWGDYNLTSYNHFKSRPA